MHKYPRTPHIYGSRKQHDDHDLESISWNELQGKNLVVEEKCDGANCGVSFSPEGELLLQSRGHYLRGGPREKHFNMLKQWSSVHEDALFSMLEDRYVMYGEWMFAKHTYFYDALPHYFMEFDVLDTRTGEFLDTPSRRLMLKGSPVTSVLVLHEGTVDSVSTLQKMICRSHFITDDRFANLTEAALDAGVLPVTAHGHTDMAEEMEGLYVKWEEGGIVRGRYKFVRGSFTNAILDQEMHWHDRPIIQNRLLPGALDQMFVVSS